jgi:membrane-associated phospholipid phosphatase
MNASSNRVRAGLILIGLLAVALPVRADPPASRSSPPSSLLGRLDAGVRRMPSVDTAVVLGAGTAAALLALPVENPDASARRLEGWFFDGRIDSGDVYGNGLTQAAGAVGLLLGGRFAHRQALRDAGADLAASFLLASAATWAVKVAVRRRRPGGGPYSFPSGHTAVAFASVPVAWRHGGWRAGLASTALAISTGAARMEDRRHFLSDVLFGAAVGYAAGHAVVGGTTAGHGMWDKLTFWGNGMGVRVRF